MSNQMQQVWVKETAPNALYVDLFYHLRNTPDFLDSSLEPTVSYDQKNNTLAVQYRQCGNGFIEKNDFKDAIEQYNKSLCFAESGTDAHSLAYANRAFCFLELKMYVNCLADIELAIKANYPEKSMAKLEQRKAVCLKLMGTPVRQTLVEPQLNFDANDKVQCMANVLSIGRNDEYGRHLTAQCNIQEDRIVMVEEPLVKLVDNSSKYKRCSCCLKQCTNLVPCEMCTKALFCSGECSNSAGLHKYECNMKHRKLFDGRLGSVAQNCVKFVLRTILRGLETFSSSDELMEFVEFLRSDNDTNDVVVADGSVESMLGIFLTHHPHVSYEVAQIKILIISCTAYDYIMAHPELKTNFSTQKIQRFLMHLVTQFASIYSANNILLRDWSEKWSDMIDHNSIETFGAGLFNISSYINHACMPNVFRVTTTDHMILKTIRPIKKGEQIFVRYGIDPNWSTPRRQRHLWNHCGFKCKCQLCLSNGPLLTDISVVSTEFANLSAELAPLIFLRIKDVDKWTAIKDKLFQFVKKYDGSALPVSKSIILSYEYIRIILTKEFSCPTNL